MATEFTFLLEGGVERDPLLTSRRLYNDKTAWTKVNQQRLVEGCPGALKEF